MSAPISFTEYGSMSGLALLGSVARGKNWIGPDGKLLVSRCVSEIATAVCLAVGAVWAGDHLNVEMPAVAAMSVLAGWLGPVAVADYVTSKLNIGKKPEGGS